MAERAMPFAGQRPQRARPDAGARPAEAGPSSSRPAPSRRPLLPRAAARRAARSKGGDPHVEEDLAIHFGGVHALDGVKPPARAAEDACESANAPEEGRSSTALSGSSRRTGGRSACGRPQLNGSHRHAGARAGRTVPDAAACSAACGARQPHLRLPHADSARRSTSSTLACGASRTGSGAPGWPAWSASGRARGPGREPPVR